MHFTKAKCLADGFLTHLVNNGRLKHVFFIWAILLAVVTTAGAQPTFLGVASGDITESEAVLWTQVVDEAHPAELPMTVTVSTRPSLTENKTTFTGQSSTALDCTAKVLATGLQPGTVYYYQFSAGGQSSPMGRFKTPPAAATVPNGTSR